MPLISNNVIDIRTAKELGVVLRKKRKAQGLTQIEVAEHCGVSARFISEVERGKETAEIGKVLTLAATLGIDLIADSRD